MRLINEFRGLSRINELSSLFAEKKILLVTGAHSFEASGANRIIEENLVGQNIVKFNEFSVNPKIEDAINGANIANKNSIEVIIAIGGGSVLDMAKLIKAFLKSNGNEHDLAKGVEKVADPNVPLIAIPTTAGSGSEATHFAVVYLGTEKYSLAADCLLPDAVILDGALLKSGNKYQKSCNALDAMAQAIESAWAAGSTAESLDYAFSALQKGWKILPEFLTPSCSEQSFQNMLFAAHLAGKAINISKTTAAHAWSYAFTSHYNIPHGHAVWLTLPAIFEMHAKVSKENVTDQRGPKHLNQIIEKLSYILGLQKISNAKAELQNFLQDIEIEYLMEKLGPSHKHDRQLLACKVNMERMKNNPVNLSGNISYIFEVNQ